MKNFNNNAKYNFNTHSNPILNKIWLVYDYKNMQIY